MKKVMLLCLVAMMVACPTACVNDPTESDSTCVETSSSTSEETDFCVLESSGSATELATSSVVDTSTKTVVE